MPLGYIVENRVLRRALLDRARALPSLTLSGGRRVAAMHATDTGADIALDDGTRLRARLVAAADGKESPLRHAAGIRAVEWRYRQIGIVTTVAHERPHAGIAVEHFLPAGPFAILPMTDEPAQPGSSRAGARRSCGPSTPISRRACWRCPKPDSPPNCAPASASFSARSSRSGRAGATRSR